MKLARSGIGNRKDAVPVDPEDADRHEENERHDLPPGEDDRRARAGLDPPDVDPREDGSGSTIVAHWPTPLFAAGQRYPTARAKKTESPAIEEMRAIHVIQPTSNPTKSPKAACV